MQHLDEGTIHAWLDGALSSEEVARAEAHVASCSVCANATAEARGLIAASSRILTALDNVPSVRVSPGSAGRRRFLMTWLVREKIAAVVTLVVAGGALALVMSRNTRQAAEADLASEPVRTFELAVADSAPPPPVAREELANRPSVRVPSTVEVAPPSAPPRDVAAGRAPEPAPTASIAQEAPKVIAEGAPASVALTDDSLRPVAVAQAERAVARDASAQAGASPGRVGAAAAKRRAVDAPVSSLTERPSGQALGTATGAGNALPETPRLVQEEKMVAGDREGRRRIYSVEGILVTLDEWSPPPTLAFEQRRAASAYAPPRDSAAVSTTIRWTDASGKEFTLTGAAPTERLERIRKLLGL